MYSVLLLAGVVRVGRSVTCICRTNIAAQYALKTLGDSCCVKGYFLPDCVMVNDIVVSWWNLSWKLKGV